MTDAHDHRGEDGYCGFCGGGNGYLGETGDERSQMLLSSVRSGEPGNWTYDRHPNHLGKFLEQDSEEWRTRAQYIYWCGVCDEGLAHRHQRYTDANLIAKLAAYKVWEEIDPCQWDRWSMTEQERQATIAEQDDPAVHMEKLHVHDSIELMERELRRRGVA